MGRLLCIIKKPIGDLWPLFINASALNKLNFTLFVRLFCILPSNLALFAVSTRNSRFNGNSVSGFQMRHFRAAPENKI
jgi:hypothetical protein